LRALRRIVPAQSISMPAGFPSSISRFRYGGLRILVLSVFALVTATWPAGAQGPAPKRLILDRALTATSPNGSFPVGEKGASVTLPDDWSQSRPDYDGSVWYRLGLRIAGEPPSNDLVALYIERACSNLQVRLNGVMVFSGGRMEEPLARNCNRPQLVPLPPSVLHANENVLDIRVQGHSLGRVATRGEAGGLSPVEVDFLSVLRARHAERYFWGVTWVEASSLLLIGMGCVLIAVGWLNRREVYFSYLGWLGLAWATWSLAWSSRDMPWSTEVTEFLLCSAWSVLVALAIQFFLTFAGRRSRVIENLIALQWVLLPASLILVGPQHMFDVAIVWYFVIAAELVGVMGIYLTITRRQRPQDFLPMAVAVTIGTVALVAELAAQAGVIASPAVSPGQIAVPILFVAVGLRLFLMFAKALRATEADRNRVAGELQRLKAEMQAQVEDLTAQRVGQFTELERTRIASDLHDDLGAKLLTIVHTRDSARIPDLAREALEEMRLSVRGLAGRPVRLDDAIADWRSETMERLGQAHIEARWDNPTLADPPMLSSRMYMQLTRVLREAVSNVIKHSGAVHCVVGCLIEGNDLKIVVRDDGRGIHTDVTRGQGMSTMKRRAKRMNGQCLVESRPGYGVVILLTVPLRVDAADLGLT
jgi:two-component system sensor histidine kinase UhpB